MYQKVFVRDAPDGLTRRGLRGRRTYIYIYIYMLKHDSYECLVACLVEAAAAWSLDSRDLSVKNRR